MTHSKGCHNHNNALLRNQSSDPFRFPSAVPASCFVWLESRSDKLRRRRAALIATMSPAMSHNAKHKLF